MLGLLLLESALLLGGIYFSGVTSQLRQNSNRMLDQQVENRRNYLENVMTTTWSDLTAVQSAVNNITEDMVQAGTLDLDALGSEGAGEGGSELLTRIAPELISTLYSKRLSGIFVILNTAELTEDVLRDGGSFSGICIRDMDPASPQSEHNADLLLTRAPVGVVRALNLSTSADWAPRYEFSGDDAWDFFKNPFEAAWSAEGSLSVQYCGYWSEAAYQMPDSSVRSVSYSQPLVMEDGTVYGVLGVELQTDYLMAQLPSGELHEGDSGTYFLAVGKNGTYTPLLASGAQQENGTASFTVEDSARYANLTLDGRQYRAAVKTLGLYGRYAPFSDTEWALVGAVSADDLYYFPSYVLAILVVIVLTTCLAGLAGTIFISRRLANPIRTLADQVAEARQNQIAIPTLPATGIAEIDQFSEAIVTLNRSTMEFSTRMLRIVRLASVELGGFECHGGEPVFVTANFFPMLGLSDVDGAGLSREEFGRQLAKLTPHLVPKGTERGVRLYKIVNGGAVRYIRVSVRRDEDGVVGLAEDATAVTLERMRIEHDRDYDLLTGIYNRRAFNRMAGELFEDPGKMKVAALLMIDLDNLKGINDQFGHDYGDQYIHKAAQCFLSASPPETLVARQSGDEFNLLFYGYADRAVIRRKISHVLDTARQESILLPNGKRRYLSISGGVAWYPEDSGDFGELMKYADFAMYQIKHVRKNGVAEFDRDLYEQANDSSRCRREFREVMEQGTVTYHFQPIADAHTGAICAYEALMRVDAPTLKGPIRFLEIARRENRLGDIERMTWFKAAESYSAHLQQGQALPEALLFINSISNQCMTPGSHEEFHRRFAHLQPRIVMEVVEDDHLDKDCIRAKREAPGFSGMMALDDYGSGYNSEKNLLELSPKFVKVDISIIKNIDKSRDQQEMVSNLVNYAHQREMLVIAEAVETAQELETVIRLGVDLAQGFYLGRPAAIPPKAITPESMEMIRKCGQRDGGV